MCAESVKDVHFKIDVKKKVIKGACSLFFIYVTCLLM